MQREQHGRKFPQAIIVNEEKIVGIDRSAQLFALDIKDDAKLEVNGYVETWNEFGCKIKSVRTNKIWLFDEFAAEVEAPGGIHGQKE